MKLTIGFSPCPNDTFMFYGLINKKIDTYGLEFKPLIKDVEELNRKALNAEPDITKMSFATFFRVSDRYDILDSGAALGNNCGPLLIGLRNNYSEAETAQLKVAIPGEYTTANFLLSFAFPEIKRKVPMIFSEVEQAVLNQKTDIGVIIHENRFTYQQKGLKKIADLGEIWEQKTGLPIPLGGIAVKKNLPFDIKQKMNKALSNSVLHAFQNKDETMPFVRQYAQEMQDDVMQNYIHLYVNNYSVSLGQKGRKALEKMHLVMSEAGIIEKDKEFNIIR
ncbi:MAG: 1,4-dihydroxy-6-naphthoate synthase [Bacteroidetes bacterium]|nr:MAG: 1,4-dihydroxy-6-naphthoate synthase [Bacteroidota bacterium]